MTTEKRTNINTCAFQMISVLLIPEYYSPVNWVNNIYVYPDVQALYTTISSPIIGHWPLLQWRGNERDDVSNHQAHDCLLNRLFTGQGYLPFGVRPAIGGRPPIEVRCTSIEVHLNYRPGSVENNSPEILITRSITFLLHIKMRIVGSFFVSPQLFEVAVGVDTSVHWLVLI